MCQQKYETSETTVKLLKCELSSSCYTTQCTQGTACCNFLLTTFFYGLLQHIYSLWHINGMTYIHTTMNTIFTYYR